MSDGREKCEAGCIAFYGGERRHHKDCVHYPESMTKLLDEADVRIAELEAALRGMLDHYVDLAESGDCGNWDPEEEMQVRTARAALQEERKDGDFN